ncbi:MAG: BamA/TamA family outer membrane protein, partial [Pseudomonadota bacterium]
AKTIRDVLHFETAAWWNPTTWYRKQPHYSPTDLEAGIGRLEELYHSEGYYNAQIASELHQLSADRAAVSLKISEGGRTLVRQVNLEVTGDRPDFWRDQLRPLLTLAPGDPFTAEGYQRAKAVLADRLLNEGYPRVNVTGDVVVVRSTQEATVNIKADTGDVGCFGETTVKGLSLYDEGYVRGELAYRPGQIFRQRQLDESQRRIYRLGLFNTALVRPLVSQTDGNTIPIEVAVNERKRYTTRVGAGYGSEDQFRCRASWTVRKFMGDLRTLTLTAKYSSLVAGLQAGFTQPYFIDRKSNLYNDLELIRNTLEAYTTEALNNRLIVDRTLSRYWTVYGGHRLEMNRLMDVTEEDAVPGTIPHDSIISAAEAGATRDTTTDPYYPEQGSRFFLAYEQATQGLLSEIQYVKGVAEGRLYQSLWPKVVLATRLKLGTVSPTENTLEVPIYKRFFSGGTDSVRGYGFQMLGPLDVKGKPTGGVSLTEGSIELRYPIHAKLFGVTFVDFGQVSLREFDYDPAGLRFCAGTGLRYQTIVGPIRLDWAYKLNPEPDGEPGRWHIHFSVGQAF